MTTFEESLYNRGFTLVGGLDEAGRGPLAGPVVACAVLIPRGLIIDGVDDSKKLSAKKRNELAAKIKKSAISYGIGITDSETIDRINILQATLLAMTQAVNALTVSPDALLVDGLHAPPLSCYCQCLPHGDTLSHSIAAASIIAKVYRDALMDDLHLKYPEYGFNKHKGYGTAAHREAIKKYGFCPQHRRSFKVKFDG
jgi:ribonuclease HII